MSTRIFPLLAFAIWCFLCRSWYVCDIKERCGTTVAMSKIGTEPQPAVETPAEPAPEAAPKVEPQQPDPAPPAPEKKEPPVASSAPSSSGMVDEMSDKTVIHYDYNKLDKEANADVDEYLVRLAADLKSTGKTVTLVGHTDAVGDGTTNILVSERRAKNVRDILKEKGVAAGQIKTVGKGESQPVGTNDNPDGRRQNRRVEVFLGQ